jgi:uncharacterized membrane protein YkoI
MKTSKKIALATALMSILGVGAVVKIVDASPSSNSVQVAEASDGDGEINDDQQEDKKLQALAKITAEQAKQAAETSVGGKASSVKLENEDGNLVYAVEISQKEVKVDAGNGKVLYTENANQENNENEAPRPKSSIQVKENNNEQETNEGSK